MLHCGHKFINLLFEHQSPRNRSPRINFESTCLRRQNEVRFLQKYKYLILLENQLLKTQVLRMRYERYAF